MNELILNIELLKNKKEIPFDLLQLADPSIDQINDYLKSGKCYIAKLDSQLIGVIVLNKVDSTTIEIKNIAIKESVQGKGFGKVLLRYAYKISKESNFKKLVIGTGNSSINQLALYQKEGFEMSRIDKGFFIRNYKEAIFENGIQCKHMIILEKQLKEYDEENK
ncbi:GNAT family N-acetyltransferase [Tenacibaculum ovolyticum]|uniref:GNAT family N-acetyltransferase n=1 Tax=Tenacibaculum ovolyticum TaxID=104270 RepID=UPI0004299792|nr:GNAT family N-acetyltransferase [Tenacibaculum ovolyticum]